MWDICWGFVGLCKTYHGMFEEHCGNAPNFSLDVHWKGHRFGKAGMKMDQGGRSM